MSIRIEHQDERARRDAVALGVASVYYVDLPDWWCRLTAPFVLSWKREAAVLLALPLAGFAVGLLAGLHLRA